jgi:hypothetical protein
MVPFKTFLALIFIAFLLYVADIPSPGAAGAPDDHDGQ